MNSLQDAGFLFPYSHSFRDSHRVHALEGSSDNPDKGILFTFWLPDGDMLVIHVWETSPRKQSQPYQFRVPLMFMSFSQKDP